MTIRMIIDCDPGNGVPATDVDDALAIGLALANPEIDVEAITIVAGNTPRDNGYSAARTLLAEAGSEVPVYTGAATALLEPPERWESRRQAKLATADARTLWEGVPAARTYDSGTRHTAAAEIARRVAEAPGEITLVAIGPLTNVAHALQLHPDLPRDVAEIVIMDGAFDVPRLLVGAQLRDRPRSGTLCAGQWCADHPGATRCDGNDRAAPRGPRPATAGPHAARRLPVPGDRTLDPIRGEGPRASGLSAPRSPCRRRPSRRGNRANRELGGRGRVRWLDPQSARQVAARLPGPAHRPRRPRPSTGPGRDRRRQSQTRRAARERALTPLTASHDPHLSNERPCPRSVSVQSGGSGRIAARIGAGARDWLKIWPFQRALPRTCRLGRPGVNAGLAHQPA